MIYDRILPAGLLNRHASELRAQVPRRHRHRLLIYIYMYIYDIGSDLLLLFAGVLNRHASELRVNPVTTGSFSG